MSTTPRARHARAPSVSMTDAFEAQNFNPIAFVNDVIPDERALAGVEKMIENLLAAKKNASAVFTAMDKRYSLVDHGTTEAAKKRQSWDAVKALKRAAPMVYQAHLQKEIVWGGIPVIETTNMRQWFVSFEDELVAHQNLLRTVKPEITDVIVVNLDIPCSYGPLRVTAGLGRAHAPAPNKIGAAQSG